MPTDAMAFADNKSVQQGLIRLNTDTLKIPIRWPVLDTTKSPPALIQPPEQGDTIALLAAQAADPGIETRGKMPRLIAKQINPYTTFIALPTIDELTAVCSAEPDPILIDGKTIDCSKSRHSPHDLTQDHQSLQGKVVAVGDLSDDDMQSFPGGDKPGVYLQANYVESLLDQRFLTEVPLWLTLAVLVLFIVAVYVLYWAHDRRHRPYISSPERAFIASAIAFTALLLVSFQALLVFQYFTPLWALWGAGFFLVFRYLEESGYHRSRHLLAEVVGEVEHIAGEVENAVEGKKSHPNESTE
jgi:CHASE2 domain